MKEISLEEAREFCNRNHIQGYSASSIKLGLYYNNELVEVMTFRKPRFNKKYQWELVRLCTANGFTITGGSSKLFNYFVKNYHPSSIISYCDNDKFTGKIYNILGFNECSHSIDYIWTNGDKVLSRYKCQKRNLSINSSKTEVEIMTDNEYVQMFKSGQSSFVWKNL